MTFYHLYLISVFQSYVYTIQYCLVIIQRVITNNTDLAISKIDIDNLYARYLCSRDALGLCSRQAKRARDDRVSCIQIDNL